MDVLMNSSYKNNNISHLYPRDILISDAVFSVIETILDKWICLFVCLIGIVANVIEICVFTKQGFKDTVNISMTFIAFWDLLRVISGAGHRLYGPISLFSPAFGKSWQNVTLIYLSGLHNISSNVSYMLGAYVAVERCLSVSIPFKVKLVLTVKVTTTTCVIISVVVFCSFFPLLLMYEPKLIFSLDYQSYITVFQGSDFYRASGGQYSEANKIFGFAYPVISLTSMVVSTLVISHHLRKSSNFRQNTSSHKNKFHKTTRNSINHKEKQIVKMLLVIINIYILNLIPRVANYLAKFLEPEYDNLRIYNNLFRVTVAIVFFLDFVNSSVHLFIFYTMSSKFRKTFDTMFHIVIKGGD